MTKNEIISVEVTDWSSDGAGVARKDRAVIFVSGGVPGDICDILLTKVTPKYSFAKIAKLHTPSPLRENRSEICAVEGKCGGCMLRHVSYSSELEFKRKRVSDSLKHIGGVDFDVPPVLPSPVTDRYRNKVIYQFGFSNGKPAYGFFRRRSHDLLLATSCMLQSNQADLTAKAILKLSKEFKLSIYDEKSRTGDLRRMMYRESSNGSAILVVCSATSAPMRRKGFIQSIVQSCPWIIGVALSINPDPNNTVLADDLIYLYGDKYIIDQLFGLEFEISPLSFYQVNRKSAELVYELAVNYALGGKTSGKILDLYCGAGTLTLALASRADQQEVIGVEIIPDAVKDAKRNANRNKITNASFVCADVGTLFGAGGVLTKLEPSVIVVDPPRKGLSQEAANGIISLLPDRIVYVSCDPATLARDIKIFISHGYALMNVQPVDMFPKTEHVETVCLLSKLKTDKHIEIDLDMSELDLTAAESKATYEEIKEYVLEHSGLKVSHLYIAQVKRKHGIIERDNYNLPKGKDSKQPQCPPDKEKAIVEALKHFGML